ncbi:SET and MYND domain-containing protein 4-like protein [Dinothrombium tinctorium]|uniref:Protein-lysine N-methyltransferase SMYD4 n=1 Tax=Dinothrombium tinctorium TaxID=1965070 RepID=A0A443QMI1_9ACAR|nr:SET and MYND domain-containing protein 4-like protein [Dinothrombium tinctorium]RWS04222.1 SET and MYND domain-containing protein 4-like protein [Dinothrombium tinctorium]
MPTAYKLIDELVDAKNLNEKNACQEQWDAFSTFVWDFSNAVLKDMSEQHIRSFRNEFEAAASSDARIKMLLEHTYFASEINFATLKLLDLKAKHHKKDIKKAIESAECARQCLVEHQFEKALTLFNEAIANTQHPSVNNDSRFGEYLSDRGDCLFKMQHYRAALLDYEETLLFVKSQSDIPWIWFMKSECLKQLGNEEKSKVALKMAEQFVEQRASEKSREKMLKVFQQKSMAVEKVNDVVDAVSIPVIDQNEKLPGAIADVYMDFDSEKGRIMRAAKEIPKGTIIVSENAIASWLCPYFMDSHCNHCLQKLNKRFICCRNCTFVKYCSLSCEENAWTKYHRVECDFLEILKHFSFGHLALRLIIIFGFENVLKIINEEIVPPEIHPKIGFAYDYRTWYSMFSDFSYLSFQQLLSFCCGVSILTKIAKVMGVFDEDENFSTFAAVLLKHIIQINYNSYSIYESDLALIREYGVYMDKGSGLRIGNGLYLSASLPSHSCCCNSTKYSIGSQILLVNEEDIKAGDEVTVTYFPHYTKMCVKDRKAFLKAHYSFDCRCEACENKWENVFYALRCEKCSGALIWSEDDSNYCLNCESEFNSLNKVWQEIDSAKADFEHARDLLDAGHLKRAKTFLDDSLEKFSNCYFSFTQQAAVTEQLCRYFELQKNYKEAFNQCLKLAQIEQKINGEETLEAVAYLIKCVYFKSMHMNSSFKHSFLSSLHINSKLQTTRDLLSKVIEILTKIAKRQFKIVSAHLAPNLFMLQPLSKSLEIPFCVTDIK